MGCPGGPIEMAIAFPWVYDCPPGTQVHGFNSRDHSNPVVCKQCPWNFSCPDKTLVHESTHPIPWVWSCPAGTYGVGANTDIQSASCIRPCMPMRACMGTTATIIHPHDLSIHEVSFSWDGSIPWTMSCMAGTYPSSNNTDRNVASCLPCPRGMACPWASHMDAYTNEFHGPFFTPHLSNCPVGMHLMGNGSFSVGQCVRF